MGLILRSALIVAVFANPAFAQTPAPETAPYTPTLTFDVASIRQSPEADSYMVSGSFSKDSTSLHITNYSIQNLLGWAYDIRWDQVVGLPAWPWVLFNIDAKADPTAAAILAKLTPKQLDLEQQHMMQALLADRFGLKTHWETRQSSIYHLVVGKQGPKLSPAGSAPPTPEETKDFGSQPIPVLYQRNDSPGYDFVGHACTASQLAEVLADQFGHPVLDQTGLTGKYDFILRYHGTRIADRVPDDLDPVPPLEQALQEQLGLKLVPAKGSDRFLVIDHIEKPTAN